MDALIVLVEQGNKAVSKKKKSKVARCLRGRLGHRRPNCQEELVGFVS